MSSLTYDRYANEILAQTDLMRSAVKDADRTAAVPTCPGWNLGQLLRHVGGMHRWVEAVVRTRATEPSSDELVNGELNEDPDVWLADGAARLDETLRAAGPQARVWTPVPERSAVFWARRMVYETVVHRYDASLAAGAQYPLDPEVAAGGIDEWLDAGSRPHVLEERPGLRALLGPGRSLHLHATDASAEWVVDLSGEPIMWQREHEKATVAVRGPVTNLLLAMYSRPADVEVLGDAALFESWLGEVSFWLHE